MKNRGERRAKTERIINRRLKNREIVNSWNFEVGNQKHRYAKHKDKFTGKGGSLKVEKQKENRAVRHTAKQKIKAEREIPVESKHSIRWAYW